MNTYDVLEYVKSLSTSEQRAISHKQMISFIEKLTEKEIIELSTIIGYPVFIRLCMGEEIGPSIPIIQDGAAVIIVNEEGQILMQRRTDNDKWGLPGGCQEVGETFEEVAIREVKEESNLDIKEEDLIFITVVSGSSRRNSYPNGNVVFNNTALFVTTHYSGELKWDKESKEMKFFDIDFLPMQQNDPDLIYIYKKKVLNRS